MIILKYPAKCAETGKPLKPGDSVVYYPSSPKGANLFHPDSKTAAGYRDWAADQDMGYNY